MVTVSPLLTPPPPPPAPAVDAKEIELRQEEARRQEQLAELQAAELKEKQERERKEAERQKAAAEAAAAPSAATAAAVVVAGAGVDDRLDVADRGRREAHPGGEGRVAGLDALGLLGADRGPLHGLAVVAALGLQGLEDGLGAADALDRRGQARLSARGTRR
jgi:hypothetical protein